MDECRSNPASPDDIVSLFHRGLDVRRFSLAAARALRRVVPFDGVCVLTMDPATLLPTGHVIEDGLPEAMLAALHGDRDPRAGLQQVPRARAQSSEPAASLSEATGGRLDRSLRHRELRRPHGFGDELRAAFAGGGIVLLREAGAPDFTRADTRLLAALSKHLPRACAARVLLTALAAGEPSGDAESARACCCSPTTTRSSGQRRGRGVARRAGDGRRASARDPPSPTARATSPPVARRRCDRACARPDAGRPLAARPRIDAGRRARR